MVLAATGAASEETGYAFFQDEDAVLDACGLGFPLKQLQRLIDGLVGEAEGTVVHRDHPAGVQVQESAGGV